MQVGDRELGSNAKTGINVRVADFSLKWLALADSGHYINFSQTEKLAAVIRSFLLDQPPRFLHTR
jgi:hypothetical protein